MPWRGGSNAGASNEDADVEGDGARGAHHPRDRFAHRRFEHETIVAVDLADRAGIVEEVRVLGRMIQVVGGALAWLTQVLLDSFGKDLEPLGIEEVAQDHNTISLVAGDLFVGNRMIHRGLGVYFPFSL